jgi:copper chaperone CopZ
MRIPNYILVLMIFFPTFSFAKAITIKVNGLVCAFCAQGIEKHFKENSDVGSVSVDLNTKIVDVQTKGDKDISDEMITKIIRDAGFTVVEIARKK